MTASLVHEILDSFGTPERPNNDVVPAQKVLGWAQVDDLETQGALQVFLSNPVYAARVHPPIPADDLIRFLLKYYERCIHEDPTGGWVCSRYEAAREITRWFRTMWRDPGTRQDGRRTIETIKEWLARIYRDGDAEIRESIINGTLEHLFESQAIASFFDEWKDDPVLGHAYTEAVLWSNDPTSTAEGTEK